MTVKLNSTELSRNILRSLAANTADLPALEAFPKSHSVTFLFYSGLVSFLSEEYASARESLEKALSLLPSARSRLVKGGSVAARTFRQNRGQVLSFLIPTVIITQRKVPSERLLAELPATKRDLFTSLDRAIKAGNIRQFDDALEKGFFVFAKQMIYVSLEQGRLLCLRSLFRRVYLAAGMEADGARRTRIRIEEFIAGVRASTLGFSSEDTASEAAAKELHYVDRDEVECLLANQIHAGLIKGYISRERGIVVLSKAGAFPGTGV